MKKFMIRADLDPQRYIKIMIVQTCVPDLNTDLDFWIPKARAVSPTIELQITGIERKKIIENLIISGQLNFCIAYLLRLFIYLRSISQFCHKK